MIRQYLWVLIVVLLIGCNSKLPWHPTAESRFFGVNDSKQDITDPQIILHQQRGIVAVPRKMITITGQAIDESGISSVIVNNKKATLDKNGYFSAQILFKTDQTIIHITATDNYNNSDSKIFNIGNQVITPITVMPQLSSGNYYALVIGINTYQYMPQLKTAVNDAKTVAKILKNKYGFQVTILLGSKATRSNIVSYLNKAINRLDENDHLLIYYAGHGYFDKQAQEAYWQPYDAGNSEDTNWIISDRITSIINRSIAKNILIVADSCYSGTLTRQTRGIKVIPNSKNRQYYLKNMLNTRSRLLIASGGNEPVSDSGGDRHSIFAKYFLKGLQNMQENVFTSEELFEKYIEHQVQLNSNQTPNFQEIRKSGHEGGDFIFQKK